MIRGRKTLIAALSLMIAGSGGLLFSETPANIATSLANGVGYLRNPATYITLAPWVDFKNMGEKAWALAPSMAQPQPGVTALSVLAQVMSYDAPTFGGVPLGWRFNRDDDVIGPAVNYLLNRQITTTADPQYGAILEPTSPRPCSSGTYNTACTMWAFIAILESSNGGLYDVLHPPAVAEWRRDDLEQAVDLMAQYLARIQRQGPTYRWPWDMEGGWSYGNDCGPHSWWADLSNTQFAVWGLRAWEEYRGITPPGTPVLAGALPWNLYYDYPGYNVGPNAVVPWGAANFITRCNDFDYTPDLACGPVENGGFTYQPVCQANWNVVANFGGYGSMTGAGLGALFATGTEGIAAPFTSAALGWVNTFHTRANLDKNPGSWGGCLSYHYHQWTMAKAMAMYWMKYGFQPVDFAGPAPPGLPNWYRQNDPSAVPDDVTDFLISIQHPTGEWENIDVCLRDDRGPHVSTVFSLLAIEQYNPALAAPPPNLLWIILQSPGEVYIEDQYGQKTGIIAGQLVEDIPGTSSTAPGIYPQKIQVDEPLGAMDFKVTGTQDGTYTVTADLYLNGILTNSRHKTLTKAILKGETDEYRWGVQNVNYPMQLATTWGAWPGISPLVISRKHSVELEWITTVDADSLEIQRSTDDVTFNTVATVSGDTVFYTDEVEKAVWDEVLYYRVVAKDSGSNVISTSASAPAVPYKTAGHFIEVAVPAGVAVKGQTLEIKAKVDDSRKRPLPGTQIRFTSLTEGTAFTIEEDNVWEGITDVDGYATAHLFVNNSVTASEVQIEAFAFDLEQGNKGPEVVTVPVQ